MLIDMKRVRFFSNKVLTTEFSKRILKTATHIQIKINNKGYTLHIKAIFKNSIVIAAVETILSML